MVCLIRDALHRLGLDFGAGERWKQHCRENGDDGDDHQQLDQGESRAGWVFAFPEEVTRGRVHMFSSTATQEDGLLNQELLDLIRLISLVADGRIRTGIGDVVKSKQDAGTFCLLPLASRARATGRRRRTYETVTKLRRGRATRVTIRQNGPKSGFVIIGSGARADYILDKRKAKALFWRMKTTKRDGDELNLIKLRKNTLTRIGRGRCLNPCAGQKSGLPALQE